MWSFTTTSALLLDLRHLRSIVLLLPSALHIRQSMLQLLFSFFAKKNDPSKSDINSHYVAFAASSMGFIMLAIILPTLIVHFVAMLQPSLPMVVISSGAENQISFLSSMKRHLLSMGDVSLWLLVASEPEINFLKGKASNRTLILGIPAVEVNLSDWKRFVQLYTPLLLWYMLGVTYRNHKNQKTISTSESLQQFDAQERNQLLGQSSLWRKRLSLAFFAWQINRISAPWTSSFFMLVPSSMRFVSSYIACGSLLLHFVVQSRFAVLTIEIFTLFMLPVGTVWPMLASQSIYTNYFVAASILSAFFTTAAALHLICTFCAYNFMAKWHRYKFRLFKNPRNKDTMHRQRHKSQAGWKNRLTANEMRGLVPGASVAFPSSRYLHQIRTKRSKLTEKKSWRGLEQLSGRSESFEGIFEHLGWTSGVLGHPG